MQKKNIYEHKLLTETRLLTFLLVILILALLFDDLKTIH